MTRTVSLSLLIMIATAIGCGTGGGNSTGQSLSQARKGFVTQLARRESARQAADEPPAGVFEKVKYASPAGQLVAYRTPAPGDGKKHPAIVWITGGDCNTIDKGCWKSSPPSNDQSAAAYRKAGVVMMFPSLRGGNDNPGVKEGFYGEIDDVLAAAEYVMKLDYVDPQRVYLGGHSTGGTVALLTAEIPNKFRAIFSFGPVDDVSGYGREFCPWNASNRREAQLRSPGLWLAGVTVPTYVIEGSTEGNASCLRSMKRGTANPNLHFIEVRSANHFSVLSPVNKLIAQKIIDSADVTLTDAEVNTAGGR